MSETSKPAAGVGAPAPADADELGTRDGPRLLTSRLLLIVSGAAAAGYLPFWVNWVRTTYLDTELRVVLTRSAERFVTRQSLALLSGAPVVRDRWEDDDAPKALHVELAEWADAVVVYPASAQLIARFALGLADTPALLALQCTCSLVGVSPSVPPGMVANVAYQRHLELLRERPNVVVAPTQLGRSASTGRTIDGPSSPLWTVFGLMERRRRELAAAGQPPAGPDERATAGTADAVTTGGQR